MAPSTLHSLLANLQTTAARPVAVEADWDGDSDGWFVRLKVAIIDAQGRDVRIVRHIDRELAAKNPDHATQRWPEAVAAAAAGEELAAALGVPFYFPSPRYPELDCPDWWHRDEGSPCSLCGVPLLRVGGALAPLLCSGCVVDLHIQERQARWTPEQRRAPKCSFCGEPSPATPRPRILCDGCCERYQWSSCAGCGCDLATRRDVPALTTCSFCIARDQLASLASEARRTLRDALDEGSLAVINAARSLLGIGLSEAQTILALVRQEREDAEGERSSSLRTPTAPPADAETGSE